jgi:hypothetical protein
MVGVCMIKTANQLLGQKNKPKKETMAVFRLVYIRIVEASADQNKYLRR